MHGKEWWANHPDKKKEYDARYYRKHRDVIREKQKPYVKQWWQQNPEKTRMYRTRQKPNTHRRHWQKRENVFHVLGQFVCEVCGEHDRRCLQLDHRESNGWVDSRRFHPHGKRDNAAMYRYYFSHPEEAKQAFQVLCANCNWKKRYEKDEHGGRSEIIVPIKIP